MNNAIEIRNLTKSYPGFTLKDVNLDLPQGSILGLVGENGAGKSTLINLIMNAAARDGGDVRVLGVDPSSPEFIDVKQDVGVVLDETCFPALFNARNVDRMMRGCYRNWDAARFDEILRRFNLPADKPFRDYSRGMRMKLAIAAALSHRPKLLLLDEATGGLDPMAREDVLDILNDFTRDETHSVLLSSHIVSDLEKICDSVAFMHRGRLLFCETKDSLMESYALLRLTGAAFEAVPPEAVVGVRRNPYGVEALVRRALVTDALTPEHTTLEEIILFFAKGADEK